MANNRLYLKCDVCGEEFFLGKRFGDGYYLPPDIGGDIRKELNEFFGRHEWCGHSQDHFVLSYEMGVEDYEPEESS